MLPIQIRVQLLIVKWSILVELEKTVKVVVVKGNLYLNLSSSEQPILIMHQDQLVGMEM